MTQHTPGPWTFNPEEHSVIVRDGDGGFVAGIGQPNWERGGEHVISNARLISAAPDLLAALETLVSELETWSRTDAVREARAAIAQATGNGEAK